MNRKKIATAFMVVAAGFSAVACSTQLPAGQQGIVADDYIIIPTDPKLEKCQVPETSEFYMSKKVYRYPSHQISWDATDEEGADTNAVVVVSNASAPAELKVPVTVTFDLTQDCDKLMAFHREFGTKYQGWLKHDGSASAGWKDLLRYVIGQPLQNTLTTVAQKHEWRKIWNDEAVRVEFQNALNERLPQLSKERTNGVEYFTNFQVTVMKPDPVDVNLKAAINQEQAAVAQARADQAKGVAEAEAKRASAEADLQAAKARTDAAVKEAQRRAAEIAGWPSVDDYNKNEAIKRGLNPYQPVIVPGMPK